jgi:hypothetical protein
MKALNLMLLAPVLLAVTPAQTLPPSGAPDVVVTKYRWRQGARVPALKEDPLRANDEQREWQRAREETTRQNAARERDGRPLLPPPSRPDGGRPTKNPEDSNKGAVPPVHARPAPGSVEYVYEVEVGNIGAKTIRVLTWEYVLRDAETGREVGSHRFAGRVSLPPGKRTKLVGRSSSPPARVVDATKADGQPWGQYAEGVVIRRVEYTDGSVWQGAAQ